MQTIAEKIKTTSPLYIILILWFTANVLQAAFTEIHYDEAYYWFYSKNLSWGYFDHPPIVALLIKITDSIHHSTLSTRFIFILMGCATLYGIFKLIGNVQNYWKTFLFILTFPLVSIHMGGFLALPDIPLVFFFVLFLFVYKEYLLKDNLKNTLLLALLMALMIYSKYHGFIVIFFTILSNLKLILKKSFWIAGILALALTIPHFLWQYNNDFPSFLYHLTDRGSGFQFKNFPHYIGSMLAVTGPFSGAIIIWLGIKFKPSNQFEKTLKYIAIGFFVLFLLLCFKGRVEAHWVATSLVALIVISYKEFQKYPKLQKVFPYLAMPVVILLVLARIFLVTNYFADKLGVKTDFHNWNNWAAELDSIDSHTPILFTHKYQNISRYSYHKNKVYPVIPHYHDRFSQVDLQKVDSIYNGKKVFALGYGDDLKWTSKNRRNYNGAYIKNYYSYTGLELKNTKVITSNDSIFLVTTLINKTSKKRSYQKDPLQKLFIRTIVNQNEQRIAIENLTSKNFIDSEEEIILKTFLKPFTGENEIAVNIGLSSGELRVFRTRTKTYPITKVTSNEIN